MELIPVIDLKGGQAVHARAGERESYLRLRSPLCDSSDPVTVVRRYFAVYPFETLYVADLDAIEGRGDHRACLEALRHAFPALTLWIDNGLADPGACRAWLAEGLGRLVIGSETQRDPALLDRLSDEVEAQNVILSLDFRGEAFQGPAALLKHAEAWPRDVIVMTLARVGGAQGPDLDRLRAIRQRSGESRIYAAGGVRHVEDLQAIRDAGASGALIATALHKQEIGRSEIETLYGA